MTGYSSIKNLLFRIDAETTHDMAHGALAAAQHFPPLLTAMKRRYTVHNDKLKQIYFGSEYANPVGLAAGFDKNASSIKAMAGLGFGFIEVGTVTPLPQAGNAKPRLFRHIAAESLQNAMGFNNDGMDSAYKQLARAYPASIPVGVNLGKNKATPQEQAIIDYEKLIKRFSDCGDYLTVNISSPNTPGLRDLQNETFIKDLFQMAQALTDKPVLLKISPDMEHQQAIQLCIWAVENGAAGIIASNTTTDYRLLPNVSPSGGISGKALQDKSFALFDVIAAQLFKHTLLISVGGIDSGQEAYRRIKAGAGLIQIYSALVFHGPGLIKKINLELLDLLEKDGLPTITAAIGVAR